MNSLLLGYKSLREGEVGKERDESGALLPRTAVFFEEEGAEHLARCLMGAQRDHRTCRGGARAVSSGSRAESCSRNRSVYHSLDCSSSEVRLPGVTTPGSKLGTGLKQRFMHRPSPLADTRAPGTGPGSRVRAKTIHRGRATGHQNDEGCLGHCGWAHTALEGGTQGLWDEEGRMLCDLSVCLQPTGPFQAGLVPAIVTLAVRPSAAWPGLLAPVVPLISWLGNGRAADGFSLHSAPSSPGCSVLSANLARSESMQPWGPGHSCGTPFSLCCPSAPAMGCAPG